MTVRVVFDATPIPGKRAGAGVYVAELLRAMDGMDVDLAVLVNERDLEEFRAFAPRARLFGMGVRSRPLRLAWAHLFLPRMIKRLSPDVFHGPHYTVPKDVDRAVVTFHDPTFFTHPDLHERTKVAYFTRAARSGVKRADRVIAVSEYAREGAIAYAGADPESIDVVYEGVDLRRYSPGEADERKPYILFVGTLEPRKDVPTLIEAYSLLGAEHELVLCGQEGWGSAAIDRAIDKSGVQTIRRTGYVSETEKIELYRGASLVVYPSIAEGFGLPVLEAMACGAPVVTTTGSAPEEIAGDAALLVPPQDPQALREAMERALSDDALRAEAIAKGIERARSFTWQRAAEQTLTVWRKVAA